MAREQSVHERAANGSCSENTRAGYLMYGARTTICSTIRVTNRKRTELPLHITRRQLLEIALFEKNSSWHGPGRVIGITPVTGVSVRCGAGYKNSGENRKTSQL